MVWAGISYDGKTALHISPPGTKIDKVGYMYCMEQALPPAITDKQYLYPSGPPKDCIYMQDGAPAHRANVAKDWLKQELPRAGLLMMV